VCLDRFVFDDWVPKKLEIDLEIPDGDDGQVDLEKYKSTTGGKLAEGEEGMPKAE